MKNTYTKPVVSVDTGLAEGVYAASGAAGSLTATYYGVWDRWAAGGKGLVQATWTGLDGSITLTLNFNDTIDDIETDDASVQKILSGNKAQLTFASTAANPLTIGVHLNHGTSIDDLSLTGYTYDVI